MQYTPSLGNLHISGSYFHASLGITGNSTGCELENHNWFMNGTLC